MPDPRSVMKEYRYLEEKRLTEGLTPEEDARYGRLRDLVAPETSAPATAGKPGFDVGAAAAALRESLLPAGLRNRPPPVPDVAEPFAEAPPPPFEPAQLGVAGDAQPFDLGAQAYDPAAPFDPAAQAYDPNAQPLELDPNAQGGWDPNAQAGWDPNAAWEPNAWPADGAASPGDPAGQPYDPALQLDPGAQTYDPGAQPNAQAGWDPNAAWDPSAWPANGAASPGDPAGQPYDPALQLDPGAQTYDPSAQPLELDPNAQAGWDPNAAWDPSAWPADGAASPGDPAASVPPFDAAQEPVPPSAYPEPLAGEAAPLPPEGWDAAAPAPEPPAPGAALGDYDADPGAFAPIDLGAADALPFDAAAESALPPGNVPEAYGAPLGEYDDSAGFAAPPFASTDVLAGAAEPGAAAEAPFRLASAGSFAHEGPPWEAGAAPAPWDHAAPVDLAGLEPEPGEASGYEIAPLPPAEQAAGLDFSRSDFSIPAAGVVEAPAAPDAAVDFDVQTVEEVAIEGADVLEEIHGPDAAAPPPRSLDFEPLIPPPAAAPGEPAAARAPGVAAPAAPSFRVGGTHRVVVHTVEGQAKRGALEDPDLAGASLALALQPAGASEAVATEKVKAIFFMLAPGETPPAAEGRKVRVTFRDGRQVAGFSADYDEACFGFFVIPCDARTNTGRIWVYRSAVRQVTVS